MLQRLQSSVSCPHVTHSVLPIHRFRWALRALSQSDLLSATLAEGCQAALLLLHSWSVASLLVLSSVAAATNPPPHLWMSLRRLIYTPLPARDVSTQLSVQGVLGFDLQRMTFSAPRVFPTSPLLYLLIRLCADAFTQRRNSRCLPQQLPLYLSSFIGCNYIQ